MNVYIHLLRATEIAFLDRTDNQSSLSFHWQIQVVQRRFWETTMGWSGRILSLPGYLPAQRLMWGLRHKILGSFVRWCKTSPKLPCWANNVILILQRITLLLVSLLWQAKLSSINCPIGKSAWLFCHQQIRKFLPPTPIWCIWWIKTLPSTDLKIVLQRRIPSGAVFSGTQAVLGICCYLWLCQAASENKLMGWGQWQ